MYIIGSIRGPDDRKIFEDVHSLIKEKKLDNKIQEFDAHQEMLNDKIINHENMIKTGEITEKSPRNHLF